MKNMPLAQVELQPGHQWGICILAALKSGRVGIATPEMANIAVMPPFSFYPADSILRGIAGGEINICHTRVFGICR
jgi:hypothetical protein